MSAEVESAENLLDKQLESLSLGDKDLPEKQADQAKGDAKNKQKVRRFVKRDVSFFIAVLFVNRQ